MGQRRLTATEKVRRVG